MQKIISDKEKEWQDIITHESTGSNIPLKVLLKDFDENFVQEIQSYYLSYDFITKILT